MPLIRRLRKVKPMTWWAIAFTAITLYGLQLGREAHDSLCVFRTDLEIRAASGEKLLKENKGPLIFGIPRAVIKSSIDGQRKTLKSLGNLDC